MANIQFSDNMWCTYYEDDTEYEGFYIDCVYVGSDPQRTNIYDWLSGNTVQFLNDMIKRDLELRRAWA